MEISFQNQRMENVFNSESILQRTYGTRRAQAIQARLAAFLDAGTLAEIRANPSLRLHQLTGTRAGQFAVDLGHPYRLILRPDHDPVPQIQHGGTDLSKVTAITIIEVIDYH